MASGIIGDMKADAYNCPIETEFMQTFDANARTITTTTQAGYPAIPDGFYGVFAGFNTNASTLLMVSVDANAASGDNLMITRNVSSSALIIKPCYFYNSLLPTALIDDERNL